MADYRLIYVVDTSILIDLHIGKILVEFFKLPYSFVAPDVIIAELQEPSNVVLMELGLQQRDLTGSLVLEIVQLRVIYRRPSVNDLFAFVLARELCTPLLTNDKSLRKVAQYEGLSVHGTLWVLDEMVRLIIISPFQAANALQLMCEKGSRFPQDECDKRISE